MFFLARITVGRQAVADRRGGKGFPPYSMEIFLKATLQMFFI